MYWTVHHRIYATMPVWAFLVVHLNKQCGFVYWYVSSAHFMQKCSISTTRHCNHTNTISIQNSLQPKVNHPDFKKYNTSSMINVGGGGAAFAAPMIKRVEAIFEAPLNQLDKIIQKHTVQKPYLGITSLTFLCRPHSRTRGLLPAMGSQLLRQTSARVFGCWRHCQHCLI